MVPDSLANPILSFLNRAGRDFRIRAYKCRKIPTLKEIRGLMTSRVMDSINARRVWASLSRLSLTSDHADLNVVVSRRASKNWSTLRVLR